MAVRLSAILAYTCASVAGFALTGCCRIGAEMYLEPRMAEVAPGKTLEIGARVNNPPGGSRYVWRATCGTLDPQDSGHPATIYTAPPDPCEDHVTLEIKEGDRTRWLGEVIIRVVANPDASSDRASEPSLISVRPSGGDSPTFSNATEASEPAGFASLQGGKRLGITTFSEGKKPPVIDWGAFYQQGRAHLLGTVVDDSSADRGKVMRIAYDLPNSAEYSVFWLKFNVANFRPAEWPVITFWLRGDTNQGWTRKLKVELKLREAKWGWKMLYIADVSDKWQQYRLRLSDFRTLSAGGWDMPDEFALTFDRETTSPAGMVYLDDIVFEKE